VAAHNEPRIKTVESLLLKYGLSNRWLAKKLGVNHTSVNGWLSEDGSRPRDSRVYDQMIDVLASQGPSERNLELRRAGVRFIPIYAGIPAGHPTANDMDVDYEEVLDWGNDFERWGRIINGYSMAKMLLPGDIAVFENRRFENGDVVHAYKDGEDCVKAIRGNGDAVQLFSFNEDYEPFSAVEWKAKGVLVQRIRRAAYGVKSVVDFPHGLKWAMRHEDF
jgi:SOS-response transcriptional repressor LexA